MANSMNYFFYRQCTKKLEMSSMFQKIKWQIKKTIAFYKQQGLLQFLRRFFGKLGFEYFSRSLIFLVLDLKVIPEEIKKPYSFHIATIDDIQNEHDYSEYNFTKNDIVSRLKKGFLLFILKENNKIVFFLWVEQKNSTVWSFDNLPLYLPQDFALLSGLFTLPEFRNRGIAYKIKKEIFQYLKENSISHIIEAVHPANSIALRLDKRLGYIEYQTINYKRYWHIRLYKVQKANSNQSKIFVTLFKSPKGIWKTFL